MPGPPAAVVAGAGLAAVTVAVAAAIAIYESDDVRRYTELIRRRIAVALHSLGNELDPNQTRVALEPIFNRPEDAEGFLLSSREAAGGEAGVVDADEQTRRNQREELMYWNAIRESKLEAERQRIGRSRGASFDDFMQPDSAGENGTFVINTGADTNNREGLVRRNVGAAAGVAGLSAGVFSNPFSDDQHIEDEEMAETMFAPGVDEMSDIYSATTPDRNERRATPAASPVVRPQENSALIDLASDDSASTASRTLDFEQEDPMSMDRRLGAHIMAHSAQHGDRNNLFDVIGAWADAADPENLGSASTPTSASFSQVGGEATPDDGFSLADGEVEDVDMEAVHVGHEAASEGAAADVQSVSDGMFTPAGWSEVGSEVSESEPSMRGRV